MGMWTACLLMAVATTPNINYDESKVPPFTLPDPLTMEDGTKVGDVKTWHKRRAEILRLFEQHVYGRAPGRPPRMKWVTTSVEPKALDGKATRREVSIQFAPGVQMDLMIFVPNGARRSVPAFLGLNFQGNHAIHPDRGIKMAKGWIAARREGVVDNHATEAARGVDAIHWPVEEIIGRGYALVTAYYGDLDPDFDDGFKNGVHAIFPRSSAGDEWAALAAWSWGLMRAVDYLQTDREIDASKIAVVGHSRLGKAALWAGAQDERIAIVVSNNSGKEGASIIRRGFGETVKKINESDPHRFCANFKKYGDDPAKLPVDSHMLIALIAPRPVYVASASEDNTADPKGEFLGAKGAEPVYALFGRKGLGADSQPPVDTPIGSSIGYHLRTGKHELTRYDWQQFMNFADRHWKRSAPAAKRK